MLWSKWPAWAAPAEKAEAELDAEPKAAHRQSRRIEVAVRARWDALAAPS